MGAGQHQARSIHCSCSNHDVLLKPTKKPREEDFNFCFVCVWFRAFSLDHSIRHSQFRRRLLACNPVSSCVRAGSCLGSQSEQEPPSRRRLQSVLAKARCKPTAHGMAAWELRTGRNQHVSPHLAWQPGTTATKRSWRTNTLTMRQRYKPRWTCWRDSVDEHKAWLHSPERA